MKKEVEKELLDKHSTGYINLKEFKPLLQKNNTQGIKQTFEDAGVKVYKFGKNGKDYFVRVVDIHNVFYAAFMLKGYRHSFGFRLSYTTTFRLKKASVTEQENPLRMSISIAGLKHGEVLELMEYLIRFPEKCKNLAMSEIA